MKVVQNTYYNWYNLTYEAGIGDECMLGCYILETFEHPRNSLRYVCNSMQSPVGKAQGSHTHKWFQETAQKTVSAERRSVNGALVL